MNKKKQVQKYFKQKYFNKKNNYKKILSTISYNENKNKSNILKIIITTITTLLGTTGIVFASAKIYNEYIKAHDTIDSSNIFLNEDGITYDLDITKDMIYDEKTNLYYKVITDFNEYSIIKEKEQAFPNMSEEDFKQNSIIVVVNTNLRQSCETDLTISDVESEDTTTYVIMKQKENPNYDAQHDLWYVVVDKLVLKENIQIKIEYEDIANPNLISLDNLPNDYSIEEALKDGCFVEQDYKVLSNNKNAVDDLIDKAKNGEESSLRIYSKNGNFIKIMDLSYKNQIFIVKSKSSDNKEISVMSGKYLTKELISNKYDYCLKDFDIPNYFGKTILTISVK